MQDKLILGGHEFTSRFILGSGKYNLNLINAAVEEGGAEIITLAIRRANTQPSENILDFIPKGVTLLPNTSGARNADEAVRIARLGREMGCGDFVKIEIMCILHKFVKCCKNLEKTLIQVIHRKKHEKGGKTGVFENLSTLSTSKSPILVEKTRVLWIKLWITRGYPVSK